MRTTLAWLVTTERWIVGCHVLQPKPERSGGKAPGRVDTTEEGKIAAR
jgi:hypothetical protein